MRVLPSRARGIESGSIQPRICPTCTSSWHWLQNRSVVQAVACLLLARARQARSPSESDRWTDAYEAAISASTLPNGISSTPARAANNLSPDISSFSICIRDRTSHQFTELMATCTSDPISTASRSASTRSLPGSFKIIARTADASRTILFTLRFLTPFRYKLVQNACQASPLLEDVRPNAL